MSESVRKKTKTIRQELQAAKNALRWREHRLKNALTKKHGAEQRGIVDGSPTTHAEIEAHLREIPILQETIKQKDKVLYEMGWY
ncbi:MAG: hypothetical protein ACR2PG_02190 [Hyphomicrobiaceae bacterium]